MCKKRRNGEGGAGPETENQEINRLTKNVVIGFEIFRPEFATSSMKKKFRRLI